MDVDLIFKIAAIGILVAVLNQLLVRSGRDEQAMMTTLTGLVVVLMILVQKISDLFDLIKAVPRYAKFLKQLCTNKRSYDMPSKKKVMMSEQVSATFQRRLTKKCSDPSMFTIPISIKGSKIGRAMLDLGASINVIPSSIYESLTLGPMLKTEIVIQLADGS